MPLDFLEKVDIFKDLDDNQLSEIAACCKETEYNRGDKIFASGKSSGPVYLWVVMEGEVNLRQDQPSVHHGLQDTTISNLTETMTFGWSSLVPPFEYRLSAYCSSRKCKVLMIDKDCLYNIMEKDSTVGYSIMSEIVAIEGTRFHNLREGIIKGLGEDIMNQW